MKRLHNDEGCRGKGSMGAQGLGRFLRQTRLVRGTDEHKVEPLALAGQLLHGADRVGPQHGDPRLVAQPAHVFPDQAHSLGRLLHQGSVGGPAGKGF